MPHDLHEKQEIAGHQPIRRSSSCSPASTIDIEAIQSAVASASYSALKESGKASRSRQAGGRAD